ncbi:GNAT family N-acetyltransferase [Streptococcus iniae]|uniref:GNAT family N-acetyltransferase n=1 Tax=Streptococcus iniae TaxID=1346 RepID=UPI001604A622|nr:GNAT family N-acetyltransferase [Streptococcus iniae]
MTIIAYNKAYRDKVIAFILSIQSQEFGLPLTIDDQKDLKDITKHYQERGEFWLAIDEENNVIGTIALIALEHHNAALKKLFVHPNCRRDGLGKALLDAAK